MLVSRSDLINPSRFVIPSLMRHQDYLDVSASPDRETFEQRLLSVAQGLGFDLASGALSITRPGQKSVVMPVGSIPQAFENAARDDEQARRDPVLRRLRKTSVPVVYDQAFYVADGAADLWEEQAQYGYRTGISMVMHMPEGKHFLLGLDRSEPLPAAGAELARLIADVQLLAVYAQDAAVRVLWELQCPSRPMPHLTPREREVLLWTREGKSAWAVGQILSMSEHTVNYHLRNVMRKLDVSSKHLAILRAQGLGLI